MKNLSSDAPPTIFFFVFAEGYSLGFKQKISKKPNQILALSHECTWNPPTILVLYFACLFNSYDIHMIRKWGSLWAAIINFPQNTCSLVSICTVHHLYIYIHIYIYVIAKTIGDCSAIQLLYNSSYFNNKGEVSLVCRVTINSLLHGCSTTVRCRSNTVSLWVRSMSFSSTNSEPLQCRQNERNGVSNHQRLNCLLNRSFRRRSKKTPKLCVTGLCEGNPP